MPQTRGAQVCCGISTSGARGTHDALRPIGLTFTMPRRNSTNVPLRVSTPSAPYTPHLRNLELRDVRETKLCELLVLLLAEEADERLARKLFAKPVCRQAVLREAVVKLRED